MGLTNVFAVSGSLEASKKGLQEGFFAVSQENGIPRMRKKQRTFRKSKNTWEEKKTRVTVGKMFFVFVFPGSLRVANMFV